MADSSNLFSISGLNRSKNISGLFAHRPENTSIYFDYKRVTCSPQFVSILQTEVESIGYNYSRNTTITFPQPEHPSGIPASGKPVFSISKNSFRVDVAGSGYDIYNVFPISFQNNTIGSLMVTETGVNGSISDYEVVPDYQSYMSSSSPLPTVNLIGNNSAVISSQDKFEINTVDMTYVGMGYQTLNRNTGTKINHDPIISGSGNTVPLPSGLILKSSINPYVATYPALNIRKRPPKINKFESIVTDPYLISFLAINNYSLGDPNS
jgi:hypothetical protein